MPDYYTSILIMALIVSLMIVLEHYWSPARTHPLLRYILGILAINLPASFALINLVDWHAVLVLWMATAAAGLTTGACYMVDHWKHVDARLSASENEGKYLREAIDAKEAGQL